VFVGIIVIALGVLMLLRQLGIIGSIGEYIAPIAIIAVGIEMAFGRKKDKAD
jgi:LiaI-LiaF-like transmembrane region